jgi:lauroyl/myristoyl acyltransferase
MLAPAAGSSALLALARASAAWRSATSRALVAWRVNADRALRAQVRANLGVALVQRSEAERFAIEEAHRRAVASAWLDSRLAFSGGPAVAQALVELEGAQWLQAAAKPTIIAGAHFVDTHLALLRLACAAPGAIIWRQPADLARKQRLLGQLSRFGVVQAIDAQACVRPALRALARGLPLALLADQPDDARGALPMPFLDGGIAWSPLVAYLAERSGAQVLWMDVTRSDEGRVCARLSPLLMHEPKHPRQVTAAMAERLHTAATLHPEAFRWDRGQLLWRRARSGQSAAKPAQTAALDSSLSD